MVQLANLGPALYIFLRRCAPRTAPTVSATIFLILCCSVLSMLGLSLYWQRTSLIGGTERSWAVLLFTFLSAAADCTSSVVYWPFAGTFLPRYISGLAVGEGLSGVVAALLSQLQYATDFGFGPSAYFAALAAAVGCSAVAFWCLEHLDACALVRRSSLLSNWLVVCSQQGVVLPGADERAVGQRG